MTSNQASNLFTTPQPNRSSTNAPNSAPTTGTDPTLYSFHNSAQLAHHRRFLYTTPDTDPAASTEQRTNDTRASTTTVHPNSQTTFTLEQVQQLLQMANNNRFLPPPSFPPPPPCPPSVTPTADDPYSLLKIEQIASQGIPTKFDGQVINFASFFQEASSQINISLWKDATLITIDGKLLNLLQDFMLIPRDELITQATKRWTDKFLLLNHNRKATKEFHIKLLSLFLLNSITTEFRTVIQNRAPDSLRHDGQLLLWLICNHVHTSENAFHKSIKDIIKSRSISTDDNGNVESYVNFIKHQLRHLQTDERDKSANDLLEPIFTQLSQTGIERLTLSIDDWYEGHMSNVAPLTPLSLLNKTDNKILLLRCANKLAPKSAEPQIMALQSIIQDQNEKFTAAFSSIKNSHNQRPSYSSNYPPSRAPFDHIPWKLTPPTDVHEVRLFNNKEWRFPQAPLSDPVYLKIPQGWYVDEHNTLQKHPDAKHRDRDNYIQLLRNLYGCKQGARNWWKHLSKGLISRGFHPSATDNCLYIRKDCLIVLYTDDCLIFAPDPTTIENLITDLKREYLIGDTGSVQDFLGIRITKDDTGKIHMVQSGLINSIISDVGATDCKPSYTPSDQILHPDTNGPPRREKWNYRSVIGKLNFLAQNTRPDISMAVHNCARFCSKPTQLHEMAVKRICRYLLHTKDKGIIMNPIGDYRLNMFVDADFAGAWHKEFSQLRDSVLSRTGFLITYCGCPVTWSSKLQSEIALSTTEAEYIALSMATRQLIPLRRIMEEITTLGPMRITLAKQQPVRAHTTSLSSSISSNLPPSIVYEDNEACIVLAQSDQHKPRTKHISIKWHHFRDQIQNGNITISKIASAENIADIFTKPLVRVKHEALRKPMMGW